MGGPCLHSRAPALRARPGLAPAFARLQSLGSGAPRGGLVTRSHMCTRVREASRPWVWLTTVPPRQTRPRVSGAGLGSGCPETPVQRLPPRALPAAVRGRRAPVSERPSQRQRQAGMEAGLSETAVVLIFLPLTGAKARNGFTVSRRRTAEAGPGLCGNESKAAGSGAGRTLCRPVSVEPGWSVGDPRPKADPCSGRTLNLGVKTVRQGVCHLGPRWQGGLWAEAVGPPGRPRRS